MTRDEIIKMAREAGFSQPWTAPKETQDRLERFATLVAAAERERICNIGKDDKYVRSFLDVIRARSAK